MSLVPERRYLCAYGQNTFHKNERGEKSFNELSNPDLNFKKYLKARTTENIGVSFEDIYDDEFNQNLDVPFEYDGHIIPSFKRRHQRRYNNHPSQGRCPPKKKVIKKHKVFDDIIY